MTVIPIEILATIAVLLVLSILVFVVVVVALGRAARRHDLRYFTSKASGHLHAVCVRHDACRGVEWHVGENWALVPGCAAPADRSAS